MRWILPVSLCLVLSACGDDNRQAGGVSKAEADALDEAAATVEQGRVSADPPPADPGPQPSG